MSTTQGSAFFRSGRSRTGAERSRTLVIASTLAAGAFAITALSTPAPASAATVVTGASADQSEDGATGTSGDQGAEQGALEPTVQWPLEARDENITDGFGNRVAPCSQCSSNHRGLDFAAPTGTPVGAIADGVVTKVVYVDGGGLGLHVVVEHEIDGQTVETVSAHLDHASITVEVGDEVAVGDRIGSVGNTGASTGPHLHLETIVDGVHRDPLAVLLKYADGDDEVAITDRPSLPWLPTGPGPDEAAGGNDDASVPAAPAESDEPEVGVTVAAVDRGDMQGGVAVGTAPEVLESAEPTESIVVGSGTIGAAASSDSEDDAAGEAGVGIGVAVGGSEPEETGVSVGFGTTS